MADVMQRLCDLNLKACIARYCKLLPACKALPVTCPRQLHAALARYQHHDLGRACVEAELAGQDHAHALALALRIRDGVADALAVEVDIGLRVDADVIDGVTHDDLFTNYLRPLRAESDYLRLLRAESDYLRPLRAAMRRRSALSLMKPPASAWL